jgi:hypothetical protein
VTPVTLRLVALLSVTCDPASCWQLPELGQNHMTMGKEKFVPVIVPLNG